jgi:phosphoribosylamine---glycine ligase
MRVLVVGSGGREHALCWKIRQSPRLDLLLCVPGNAGIARQAECLEGPLDPEALAELARLRRIDLCVVGPEVPLCAGVADAFIERGMALFGPTAAAAAIEGSKAFAKQLCAERGIPTAPFGVFHDAGAAAAWIATQPGALVVKADGLAAGKGVIVCDTREQAVAAARSMLAGELGAAGRRVVVEHRLSGREASLMVLCDGERIVPFEPAQDYKRAQDGDRGPNTGGMGALSPAPALPPVLARRALETVLRPAVAGMAARGSPFRGLLYAGLMIDGDRIQLLEFNCRFGDPETQPVLMRLEEDLLPLLAEAAAGRLRERALRFSAEPAITVVVASGGYPGAFESGYEIRGLDEAEAVPGVTIFHAGTRAAAGHLRTAGGRVLGVSALGSTVAEARARAYQAAERISFQGARYRTDIGGNA